MEMHDRKRFAEAMAELFSAYAVPVTDAMMTVWWRALSPYQINEITQAFSLHVRDTNYGYRQPTPADIIKHITITMPATRRDKAVGIVRAAREFAAPHHERLAMLRTERALGLWTDEAAWCVEVDRVEAEIRRIMGASAVVAAMSLIYRPRPPAERTGEMRALDATLKEMGHGQRD